MVNKSSTPTATADVSEASPDDVRWRLASGRVVAWEVGERLRESLRHLKPVHLALLDAGGAGYLNAAIDKARAAFVHFDGCGHESACLCREESIVIHAAIIVARSLGVPELPAAADANTRFQVWLRSLN